MSGRHVAIIGGGYSGTLLAVALLRKGCRVSLIERGGRVGRGAAYSTSLPDHLLNVRAGKMSACAEEPSHFADWLEREGAGDASSFAERRLYGRYIEEAFETGASEGADRIEIIADEAVAVNGTPAGERVKLASGREVAADAVVICVGNLPPQSLRAIPPDADFYVADPWGSDIAEGLEPEDRVLLLGTGLTAIDAALTLDAAGFAGEVIAVSRRGMVPRSHEEQPSAVPELRRVPEGNLSSLVAAVRANGQEIGWQAAIDQLRPHTQAFWARLPVEERRRFLRHLRPYWDVHRHRIAPEIGRRIEAMQHEGRLTFAAGKIEAIERTATGAVVTWRARKSDRVHQITVRRIVNCTGPRTDIRRSGEPLLDQLVKAGRIRPDPLNIAIDVDDSFGVIGADGSLTDTLYAIGPMTRGAYWETVAVPDIRVQIRQLSEWLGRAIRS